MKIPWSITTTIRNPDRLRDLLITAKEVEGDLWAEDTQKKLQILLIQNKLYGYGSQQFYNGLTPQQIKLMDNPDPITFKQAAEIFDNKHYKDPAMRGRQSLNPLKKFGLVILDDGNALWITALGKSLLSDKYDLGEMLFRAFIKWQLPNPSSDDYKESDGYNIKPFIGTLHFIKRVNQKCISLGRNPVGITKEEFSLFVPTLINYRDIDSQVDKLIDLRLKCDGKGQREQKIIREKFKKQFAQEFLGVRTVTEITKFLSNLKDYGDNIIRYFRLTRYIVIRGGGFYVDLEPRRTIEIDSLLKHDSAKAETFKDEQEYLDYLSDIKQPELPWENIEALLKIVEATEKELKGRIVELKDSGVSIPPVSFKTYPSFKKEQLNDYIKYLRGIRKQLNDSQIHYQSQDIKSLTSYIDQLKNIYSAEQRSVELERLATLSLNALNDALTIKPNYPVGDDNEPTFTAPGNKPDIECFYETFNSICEVTLLKDRSQWYNEGQPVMRHIRDFESTYKDKVTYCLFVAPSMHRDTINTFWNSVKYEYEGLKQNIVPLTISQLIELLNILLEIKQKGGQLKHTQIKDFYQKIVDITNKVKRSDEWLEKIPEQITEWKKTVLS